MIFARFPFSTVFANFLTKVGVKFALSSDAIVAEFSSMETKRRLMSLFREYRAQFEPVYLYTVLIHGTDYTRFKAFLREKGVETQFTHGYRMTWVKFQGPRFDLPEYVLARTMSRRKDI